MGEIIVAQMFHPDFIESFDSVKYRLLMKKLDAFRISWELHHRVKDFPSNR